MKSIPKEETNSILRQKAEAMMERNKIGKNPHLSEIEAIKLVHELEVYQIELELQNEELVRSKAWEAELASEKYAELYDSTPSGLFTLSHEGEITELNFCGAQMLSAERSKLKNSPFAYFVSNKTQPAFHNFLGKVFNSNKKETCELTLSVNGSLPVYVHLTGITTENKTKCLLTVVDISQVKELTELNQILLSSLLHPAMYIRRKDRVVLAANKIAADLGIEVGGHCWRGFMKTNFVSEKNREILEKYPDAVPSEFDVKCSFCLSDQCFSNAPEQNIPEVHAFGQIWNTYWVKVSEDVFLHYAVNITESKRAEDALNYEKYLLNTLMNNVPAHIYFKDGESRFIRINKAQTRLFGLNDPRQAIGKTDFDFFTKEHAQKAYEDEQEIIRTGQPINLEEKETWPDHPDTWVSTTKLPMRDKDEKIIGTFGISLDITERRKAEEELRSSEKKYSDLYTMARLLADNTDDFMWAKDIDNKYIFANKTVSDRLLMAKDVDEPKGKTDDFFAQRERDAHPENPEWHTFGEICADSDMLTLSEGKSMQFDEYGNVQGKFLFLDVHKAPIRDEYGNVIGVVGTARDVTHQRQLEEEKARAIEALRLSEESLRKINEEKDKFFSIIAHDLRAPFNGFLGLTEIMAEGMSRMRLDEIQKIANVMRSSATNLFRLLGNLLEWARMQMGSIPFIPINSVLKPKILESLMIIQDMANKKEITIDFDIPEDLMVFTDVNMFGVIIRNLVTNAVKFTPKGGNVTISAKPLSDNFIEILVKDTGIGMNKSMIDNLFRLDTVTSRKGTDGESSTGLGLLICKDFIEKNGGILKIESEEGIGSTIRFTLPEKDQTIVPRSG